MSKTRLLPKCFELAQFVKDLVGGEVPPPEMRSVEKVAAVKYTLLWSAHKKQVWLEVAAMPHGLEKALSLATNPSDGSYPLTSGQDIRLALDWLADPNPSYKDYCRNIKEQNNEK